MAKGIKVAGFDIKQKLDTTLKKILRAWFNEMISYEDDTLKGEKPEALHSMRVSSRRIHTILKIFRGAFPEKKFKKEYSRIRTIKNALGEVRNYDVFLEKLAEFAGKSQHTDKRSLDLLIEKQRMMREKKRRVLIRVINNLNKEGYRKKFTKFIDTAL
jgi:CHAD domain-containing protein